MGKLLFGIALLIVTGIVGFFAYQTYVDRKVVESTIPSVKNTALRVSNALNWMTESKSGMTFKELFDKLDADIAEIDKRMLDIQTASTPSTKERLSLFADYLKSAQEVLRAENSLFRKILAVSNALDWAGKAADRIAGATSRIELQYTSKAADEALTDARKALIEKQSAAFVMRNKLDAFAELQATLAPYLPNDAAVSNTVMENAQKWLTNRAAN